MSKALPLLLLYTETNAISTLRLVRRYLSSLIYGPIFLFLFFTLAITPTSNKMYMLRQYFCLYHNIYFLRYIWGSILGSRILDEQNI